MNQKLSSSVYIYSNKQFSELIQIEIRSISSIYFYGTAYK